MDAQAQRANDNDLVRALTEVREVLLQAEGRCSTELSLVHPALREGARNLAHYVALRSLDLRPLQESLAASGLSSLGRSEAGVLAAVETVLDVATRLAGGASAPVSAWPNAHQGRARLAENTDRLLGPEPEPRPVRVMVTLPTEAASDEHLIHELVAHGMDCARINTAHDDPATWSRMIDRVHEAERALGRPCKVLMDLAGVKLRTGAVQFEPTVIRCRPHRDRMGRVEAPARVLLGEAMVPRPEDIDAVVPVPIASLEDVQCGDVLVFEDLRGKKRRLRIVEALSGARIGVIDKTCYLGAQTVFEVRRGLELRGSVPVGPLPVEERALVVSTGDRFILTRGGTESRDSNLPCISLIPEAVLDSLAQGQRIWFDDGKIGGVVDSVGDGQALIRVTTAATGGSRLRSEKGVNLPDTDIGSSGLTEQDKNDLGFIAAHADMVGLSFVSRKSDVAELREELERLGVTRLGLVLKIETQQAFRNLPQLLLEAMRLERVGVMIARGDLAVECGFERMAEVQEEILWLCEAAQVPAIWATQVLEGMTKKGRPSRAEITDASNASRAECVMLNKGPYVVQAVATLDDILRRMQEHMTKKTSLLRPLQSFHL